MTIVNVNWRELLILTLQAIVALVMTAVGCSLVAQLAYWTPWRGLVVHVPISQEYPFEFAVAQFFGAPIGFASGMALVDTVRRRSSRLAARTVSGFLLFAAGGFVTTLLFHPDILLLELLPPLPIGLIGYHLVFRERRGVNDKDTLTRPAE